ncbi:MAG: hypothetical protein IKE36_03800 [Solobacterium sp.]|nr:hypothetical protein [Solobacterium sp.]
MTKQLLVGAAKLCINPAPELFPFELSFSGDQYTGVKEGQDIHVRAITVDNGEKKVIFLGFELGGVPDPKRLQKLLKEKYGYEKDEIFATATHNHSAVRAISQDPGPIPMPQDTSESAKIYTEFMFEQIDKVTEAALANMRPAKFGYGEDKSYINVNRDQHFDDGYWMQGQNFEGCSDKTVAAVKFVGEDGNVIAAIVNYACHSVTNFCAKDVDGSCKISCDFPGIASGWLENHFGNDAVVLWQSGAAGNQNPIMAYATHRYDVNGTVYGDNTMSIPGSTYKTCVVIGEQHAVDCLRALKKADANKSWASIKTLGSVLQLPGQEFPEGINRAQHRLMVDNIRLENLGWAPGKPLVKHLATMIPVDETVPLRTQLMIVGDVAFYGMNCELYNEIGVLCKEASPYRHTIVATHTDSSIGYVLDDDSKGHKVFQSFGRVREGESNGIIVKGMLELFDQAVEE